MGAPLFICEAQPESEGDSGQLRILYANPASRELTGSEPETLIGQDLIPFLAPDINGSLRDHLHDLFRFGEPATIPDLRPVADREYELHAFPLSRGRSERWVFLLHDVTAERQRGRWWESREAELEDTIARRTAELESTHDALRKSERMAFMGTLVAGLGHDLNHLLLPIHGHLAALASSAHLDDGAQTHVKAIGQAAEYLRQLNEHLRLFAQDPERQEDSRGVTSISTWWIQVKALLEHAVPNAIEFRVDLPEDLPAVSVSSHRLTQAVLNLLINARDAITDSGTVCLWAVVGDDRKFVQLGVRDNGCGMSVDVRRRALDPFFTTKRRGRGTGLGLCLVHGIVRSVGGSIEIESKPKSGTKVVLNLPVASVGAAARAVECGGPATAAVTVQDLRFKACFEELLSSAGFSLQAAPNGKPGAVSLWVTEPSAGALSAAQDLHLTNPDCRIVLVGKGTEEWRLLGAYFVNREGGLGAMRAALSEAMSVKE